MQENSVSSQKQNGNIRVTNVDDIVKNKDKQKENQHQFVRPAYVTFLQKKIIKDRYGNK